MQGLAISCDSTARREFPSALGEIEKGGGDGCRQRSQHPWLSSWE